MVNVHYGIKGITVLNSDEGVWRQNQGVLRHLLDLVAAHVFLPFSFLVNPEKQSGIRL